MKDNQISLELILKTAPRFGISGIETEEYADEIIRTVQENLLMNMHHDLKNRYMHIDYKSKSAIQSAKENNSKCQNGTLKLTLEDLALKGYICRENGKRNGKWNILIEFE